MTIVNVPTTGDTMSVKIDMCGKELYVTAQQVNVDKFNLETLESSKHHKHQLLTLKDYIVDETEFYSEGMYRIFYHNLKNEFYALWMRTLTFEEEFGQ